MTDPLDDLARLTRLSVLEWAQERFDNTLRIMALKVNPEDRASWLEDSEYWKQIVVALARLRCVEQAATNLCDEIEIYDSFAVKALVEDLRAALAPAPPTPEGESR